MRFKAFVFFDEMKLQTHNLQIVNIVVMRNLNFATYPRLTRRCAFIWRKTFRIFSFWIKTNFAFQ